MENVLIVEGLSTVEDIEKLKDRAVAENYEFYVGISKSGDRFGIVDGSVKKLGADEVARNDLYVVKLDTVVEEEQPKEEEKQVEEEPVRELSVEEAKANVIKLANYDILLAKNAELETENIELKNEVAKLNEQIDELTIKLSAIECQVVPVHETDLADVYNFLKTNKISSLTINDKE